MTDTVNLFFDTDMALNNSDNSLVDSIEKT